MLRTQIIAEIGTGHGGDIGRAAELISAAGECGADIVKFQAVIADEILHPQSGNVQLPGGSVHLYRRFKQTERSADFYRRLKEETEKRGLIFLCTPFGPASASMLAEIDPRSYKIASPELNYFPLLRQTAKYGKPLILSTGVSRLSDIEEALQVIKSAGHREDITLLHCVTAYPAPEEQYNVSLIPLLAALFGVNTGVSDHSLDPVLVPVAAVSAGAVMIEKHFTLDKSGPGLDDPVALDPEGFSRMTSRVREAEREQEKGLPRLREEYGADRVSRVMGTGRKELPPAEADNYRTTNRSIHALRKIPAGTILAAGDFRCLRSEKNLPSGLHPRYIPVILGARTVSEIPAGHGIRWEHLLSREAGNG
ncbi:MAG: N-acetylneuraminate synthase family protein [Spirochaetia bacterium]